jgi:hypothetical protein
MAGSIPDLRGQIAAVVSGTIPLDRFLDWYFANLNTIEVEGSDEDVDLMNGVFNRYAEYTSDYIDETQLIDALRVDLREHDEALRTASTRASDRC